MSLYDNNAHVIIRGKAEAKVEFGNVLYLEEQIDGLIDDWQLFGDQPTFDSKLVEKRIERIKNRFGSIESYTGDRGFWSKHNEFVLEENNIINCICPKNPMQLEND